MHVRFMIVPGWIFSRTDGDKHWVSADELMRLHRIHPGECVIFNEDIDVFRNHADPLITLSPSSDGKYKDYSVKED